MGALPRKSTPSEDVDLVHDPARAAALLHPLRQRILKALSTPDSASGVARKLNLPRQKTNYHLRELEREGFLELVEERRKGNCVERLVRATARSYLIDPTAVGGLPDEDPDATRDRFSATYLIAAAARVIRDIATLRHRASKANQRLATMTLETELSFSSPAARHAFAEELAQEVARLVAKHHDPNHPDARLHRAVLGLYPAITKDSEDTPDAPDTEPQA
ncbi:MAG: winged helix-turn-helix domain-containing protein [Phycisphaerales bacterium]